MADSFTQSKFLLKLKTVCEDQCSDECNVIFTQTSAFILSEDVHFSDKTEAVGMIFSLLLPRIIPRDLDLVLEDVVCSSKSLFDSCLNSIDSTVCDLDTIKELLTNLTKLIEGFVCCVNYFISSEHLVLKYAITFVNILGKSYEHCAECENFYGLILTQVKDTLQGLIVQCHNFQSRILVYLNMIQEKPEYCKNSDMLVTVMEGLFQVLRPLGKALEIKSTIPIWRLYLTMLTKYRDTFLGKLDMTCVVIYLCSEVSNILEQDVLSDRSKENSKNIKLCSFLFKLIVSLSDKFSGYLAECVENIVSVCVLLLKLSPPSLLMKTRPDVSEEMQRTVLIGLDPLIENLLSENMFAPAVLMLEPNEANCFSLSCFYIAVLDLLPSHTAASLSAWFSDNTTTLLSRLFQSFELCAAECLLPVYLDGVMHNGKPQHKISFFHYTCVHVCSFISSLSPEWFQAIEAFLFSSVISCNPMVSLLSSDVLCFVARFATSDLCFAHIQFLIKVLSFLKRKGSSDLSLSVLKISTLMNRLFAFLSKEDQRKTVSELSDIRIINCLNAQNFLPSLPTNGVKGEFTSLSELKQSLDYLEAKTKLTRELREEEGSFVLKLVSATTNQTVPLRITEYVLSHVHKLFPFLNNRSMLADLLQKCVRKGSGSAEFLLLTFYQHWLRNVKPLPSSSISLLARCAAVGLNTSNGWLQELAFQRFAEISHPVFNEQLIRQTFKMCSPGNITSFKKYMKVYLAKERIVDDDKIVKTIRALVQTADCVEETAQFDLDMDDSVWNEELGSATKFDEKGPPMKRTKKCDDALSEAIGCASSAISQLEVACENKLLDASSREQIAILKKKLERLL